jgi:hypothetical protein
MVWLLAFQPVPDPRPELARTDIPGHSSPPQIRGAWPPRPGSSRMPSGDHAETAADPEAPDALRHGNVRTRRLAPLAGAGLLAFLLPLRIRASGASFAAAVVRVFACRALVLLFGLPARSRSVRSCGK